MNHTHLAPTRFGPVDLLAEAVAGLVARPSRTAVTVLAPVLGVAALVVVLGVTASAGSRIVETFDIFEATSVRIESADPLMAARLPTDADARLTRLAGVTAAGTLHELPAGSVLIRRPPTDAPGDPARPVSVVVATPGIFPSSGALVATGRTYDHGHVQRRDQVAVLGPGAARRLELFRVDGLPTIIVNDQPIAVIGILADAPGATELLDAVILSHLDRVEAAASTVLVRTEPGAAALIGRQSPVALAPTDPESLRALVPPEPQRLRRSIEGDLTRLTTLIAVVMLLVGAAGIANVTLVSVLERTHEIGLRRAVGATRRHIATQFLTESTALGLLGGLVGTSLGVIVVATVAAGADWTPVLDPWIPIAGPILGALTGLLAGTYPALRATRLPPATALSQR